MIMALAQTPTDTRNAGYILGLLAAALLVYSAERWGRSELSVDLPKSRPTRHLRSLTVAGFVITLVNLSVQVGTWRSHYVTLTPGIVTWYCIMLFLVSPIPKLPIGQVFYQFRYPHRILVIVLTTIAAICVRRYGLLVPVTFMLMDLTSPVTERAGTDLWIINSVVALTIAWDTGLILSA